MLNAQETLQLASRMLILDLLVVESPGRRIAYERLELVRADIVVLIACAVVIFHHELARAGIVVVGLDEG